MSLSSYIYHHASLLVCLLYVSFVVYICKSEKFNKNESLKMNRVAYMYVSSYSNKRCQGMRDYVLIEREKKCPRSLLQKIIK